MDTNNVKINKSVARGFHRAFRSRSLSMSLWPAVTIDIPTFPGEEEWALFLSHAGAEAGFLGAEEETEPSGRFRGTLYFPAMTAEPEQARVEAQRLAAGLEERARRHFGDPLIAATGELLPDQDWGAAWRQYFKRIRVSDRIYCGPPWESELPENALPNAFVVAIDPGQAFGTGTHETTQLCLRLLDQHLAPGAVLFDIGAGSGILSIAAAMLGARFAMAMEFDPVCEENFGENARLNGVEDRVAFLLTGDPEEALVMGREKGFPPPTFAVCNMLSVRFLPLLPAIHKANAPLILSGFLHSEEQDIRNAATATGFAVQHVYRAGEWSAFLCQPRHA